MLHTVIYSGLHTVVVNIVHWQYNLNNWSQNSIPWLRIFLTSRGQVSKTADWLRNFYKDACAQRWPLTYCGDWKRLEKSSENKKCEIERAWPVRQNLCSFINGNLGRKIGLHLKLMDCSCLPTTTTMFGFCFGLGTLEGSLDSFPLKFESAP